MKADTSKIKRRVSVILLIAVVIAALFLLLLNFVTDWLWFKEVGYTGVFLTKIVNQLKFGVPLFIILSVLMNAYLRALRRGYFRKIKSKEETDQKRLALYTNIISLVFGAVASVAVIRNLWFELLQFANSTDFGIKDPIFNLDISFYIFRYEFLYELNEMLIGIIVLFVLATLVYYMILLAMHSPDMFEEDEAEPIEDGKFTGGAAAETEEAKGPFPENSPLGKLFNSAAKKKPKRRTERKVSQSNMNQLMQIASGQLISLGIVFFLMVAFHFFLMQFDLLHAHTGIVYGAGYTDVKVTLWVYRILIALALVGAVTTTVGILRRKIKVLVIVPVAMVVIGLAGGGLAAFVQNVIVSPDEINKESEYLGYNIEYTQYAYDVDDVDVRDYAADNSLKAEDVRNNQETVTNVRINDYEPVETFYNQTQSIRQYYQFYDTDVDRYWLNGEYTQTYLSVREIDESKISDTWLNQHIKYTHGYGLALSRVDQITASGQPEVIVRNIPPQSSASELTIERPEVYFGELTNNYIIVGTNEDEFDYPDGQENKYSRYEGTAGIRLNLLNRLMFSIRESSLKLLVSTNVSGDSRIIINRNIMDRAMTIMPWLSYEDDPHGIIADGKIYWIIDAYTTSRFYPYSEPYSGQLGDSNYIRNSVKVVIDAYNGTVDYYIVDPDDPIAQTYKKIFPNLFKDFSAMPEEIKAHIRYPHALFSIQADVYGKYHMEDVKVFYQNEDIWEVSHEIYGREERKIVPNCFMLKLPGEDNAEFVSMLPYSPASKQNMTALLLARNDGEDYGELVLYRFPKSRTVYGPMQIEAQIDQNTEISQDFSLWSQAGSTYSRGNLFVLPMGESLLYVEPIYLEASNTAIPEVKRVIVAYNDRIAYEPTLMEALYDLFGKGIDPDAKPDDPSSGDDEPGEDEGDVTVEQHIANAAKAFDDAQAALRSGDWAAYGEYMKILEQELKALEGNIADTEGDTDAGL